MNTDETLSGTEKESLFESYEFLFRICVQLRESAAQNRDRLSPHATALWY